MPALEARGTRSSDRTGLTVNRREDVSLRRARFGSGRARQLRNPWGQRCPKPKATTPPPLRCCVRANNAALGSIRGHLYAAGHWSSRRVGLPCGLLAGDARLTKKARSAHLANGALVKLCFDVPDAGRRVHRQYAMGLSEGGGPRRRHRRGPAWKTSCNGTTRSGDRRGLVAGPRKNSGRDPTMKGIRAGEAAAAVTGLFGARRLRISIRCSPRPGRRCGRTSRLTSCH